MKKIMKNLFYKRFKLFCHVTKKLIFQTLDAGKQSKLKKKHWLLSLSLLQIAIIQKALNNLLYCFNCALHITLHVLKQCCTNLIKVELKLTAMESMELLERIKTLLVIVWVFWV